jgi:hypothetical protein
VKQKKAVKLKYPGKPILSAAGGFSALVILLPTVERSELLREFPKQQW